MPASHFEAAVSRQPGTGVIGLKGEVDAFAEEALNAAYADAARDNPASVLLDFREVEYINSTGIALVVGLLAQARASRRQVLACGLSDHYLEIFQITRLSDFMTIYPDEASALAAAGSSPALET